MKKVLWASIAVPYDTVGHAGGKVHNYYLKYLKKYGDFELKLVTYYWEREKKDIDLEQYGIDAILMKRAIWEFPRLLFNVESVLNPFNRYAGINQNYSVIQFRKAIKQLQNEGYIPDVVILQWTEMVVLYHIIKKAFPDAKIIGIEEDVKFLGFRRQYESEKNIILKWIRKIKYERLLKIELDACRNLDQIITSNHKDGELLEKEGILKDKIWTWQVYFHNMIDNPYIGDEKNIIFYGAMAREENWKSAIWFIENVFYKIPDKEVKFYVIGSNPNSKLLKYENDRVKILGFVDDVSEYFRHGLCLAAPLISGAGIKIKILEAMSAGIPVITNSIGIEGIYAENGKSYLHCEEVDDYIKAINKICEDNQLKYTISKAAQRYISDNYSLNKSANKFVDLINKM